MCCVTHDADDVLRIANSKPMSKPESDAITELVQAVRASQKYRAISEDLIRGIGMRELATRRTLKEAIKATKNKLHQVGGAYLEARPPYDQWLEMLIAAMGESTNDQGPGTKDQRPRTKDQGQTTDDSQRSATPKPSDSQVSCLKSQFQQVCLEIMRQHASTRERIAILETFYATTLGPLGPVRSVLDVACGLNPLAIPWMPLAPGARYYACDIYGDMMAFLNGFFRIAGIDGQAWGCDLVSAPPRQQADVALVLKALPPLDQQARNAGRDLLRALDATHILVSFPARSLGGRGKGMAENYEQRFRALAEAEGWSVERFAFATELAFLVTKG
jgi:16S rRNA (guanine(1405)-N(7))-methyltransferase